MTPNELPMEELLTTLAEESAELAQASLKLRRCLTQINPTPKSYETCIDNIPELSEYFLYANDDMFFADSVQPSDFFDKTGKPIVNLRYRDWLEPTNTHMQNILYSLF